MTTLPNPSPRDESTDHIPDTGSDTPRGYAMKPDWPAIVTDTLGRYRAQIDESNAAEVAALLDTLGGTPALPGTYVLDELEGNEFELSKELAELRAECPWVEHVVVVRLRDEVNPDSLDEQRIPDYYNMFYDYEPSWFTASLVYLNEPTSAVLVYLTQENTRPGGGPDVLYELVEQSLSGSDNKLTFELRDIAKDHDETLEAAEPFLQDKDRIIRGLVRALNDMHTNGERLDQAHAERRADLADWISAYDETCTGLTAELDEAHRHNAELRGVIQRQGGRADREHAGLKAQVTRLIAELDNANLYNAELRTIVAGRSNQVETELDEALGVAHNYRTKVAALTAELGEAVSLLEAVSAEADSYAARLKALRGAA